jgi:hypothetical protein
MSIILPEEIRDLSRSDLTAKIDEIHYWLINAREQINFWGEHREREIGAADKSIKDTQNDLQAISDVLDKLTEGDGYIKLPGGTIINYGVYKVTVEASTSMNDDITFARMYSDTDYVVLTVPMYQYPNRLATVGVARTKSAFRLYANNTTSSALTDSPVGWIAIGR